MRNVLKRYKLFREIIVIFNRGVDEGFLNDKGPDGFFSSEYVYDTITDYMDSLWDDLTKEEKDSLRKNKCKPCKGKGRGGHQGCEWICPDCNGTGVQINYP